MSYATVYSRAVLGVHAPLVTIEVHLSKGMPGVNIVGLPETVVKESRHRVRSALINSGFEVPAKKITINLAPADLPKEGGRFDLPIALGILAASGQISAETLKNYEFSGELALDGKLRRFRGALPCALAAKKAQRYLLAPTANQNELQVLEQEIYLAEDLTCVILHLTEQTKIAKLTHFTTQDILTHLDFQEVIGQPYAKRVLEIAAAGAHSVLMIGTPGSGKSMLAARLPSILPRLTPEKLIESLTVRSLMMDGETLGQSSLPEFRSPHHSASRAALIGGGSPPMPGEISLAHHGVLFLDELPEFQRDVLESLREPLETGFIHIARASHRIAYPARFQLIAAMNPCPCGYQGDPRCHCRSEKIQKYQSKISGPLLDRIDMCLRIHPVPLEQLTKETQEETSAVIAVRVAKARDRQMWLRGKLNVDLNTQEIQKFCELGEGEKKFLLPAMDTLKLSARAYHRVLKVARTLADLGEVDEIQKWHLQEALGYRQVI